MLSLQQNSLRGGHLRPSSLEGSSSHVGGGGDKGPVRLESEHSSPQEVEEDLNKVTSEGAELEGGKVERGGGEDDVVGEREENQEERSEKGDENERAKVSEESCGGDEEEEIQEGEELEKMSERSQSDGSSRKMEAECLVAKQNDERRKGLDDGRSRDEEREEADSQEERVELEELKEGSGSEEDLERCSLSNGGGAASSLERGGVTEAGASDLDDSAALRRLSPKRERLAGSLTAEVGLRLGSRVLSPRR